ncbi:hypothetical protein GCM10010404_75730 [Nonomuraea africana]|uniref:plasmid pRiA4b ORF-3 family protein n=1 Tax=Nonomuraea africana TaxID=46171 RepID=UPI001789E4E0|nr:plasmid pRiA4b ORF-3 family protein [Nonomuraea africana]
MGTAGTVGTVHQLKVTLRGVHPPVWRRVHVPSTATLDQLHEVIQVALGWEQHHLHLFGKGDLEYGDNARDETSVTLAGLIPRAGDWLGYRYDFGDMWDHDIEVEKIHRAAKNTAYPRCSGGGRACPPEDSGGPEGYEEHMRALRHRKGWKYRVAKSIYGTTRWDPARWDRVDVNADLGRLAKLWAKQAAAARQQAKEAKKAEAKERAREKAAATAPAKASPTPSSPPSSPGRKANTAPASAPVSCPVCSTPIAQARTGRPARYCGTPCRQAAHRARRRPTETASRAARLRERLADDAAAARQLADELAAALPTVDGGGQGAAQPIGWESDIIALAGRLTRLAGAIGASARDHQAAAADRQAPPTA